MTKHQSKARRKRSKKHRVLSQQYATTSAQEGQQASVASSPGTSFTTPATYQEQGIVSQSSHAIIGDLKKIGIISGAIFVVLVVLSLVLPHLLD